MKRVLGGHRKSHYGPERVSCVSLGKCERPSGHGGPRGCRAQKCCKGADFASALLEADRSFQYTLCKREQAMM